MEETCLSLDGAGCHFDRSAPHSATVPPRRHVRNFLETACLERENQPRRTTARSRGQGSPYVSPTEASRRDLSLSPRPSLSFQSLFHEKKNCLFRWFLTSPPWLHLTKKGFVYDRYTSIEYVNLYNYKYFTDYINVNMANMIWFVTYITWRTDT